MKEPEKSRPPLTVHAPVDREGDMIRMACRPEWRWAASCGSRSLEG